MRLASVCTKLAYSFLLLRCDRSSRLERDLFRMAFDWVLCCLCLYAVEAVSAGVAACLAASLYEWLG